MRTQESTSFSYSYTRVQVPAVNDYMKVMFNRSLPICCQLTIRIGVLTVYRTSPYFS